MAEDLEILKEQQEYYRARAPEYDDWFFRRDGYDLGTAGNGQWFAEVDVVKRALAEFGPRGRVLELASGTGLWTAELLGYADHITAVDGSAEVHALNRERVGSDPRVEYVQTDIFGWAPDRPYDAIFFGFWLSHVPEPRFDAFWQGLRGALREGGRVFFVDSLNNSTAAPQESRSGESDSAVITRKLKDGREFRVVKILHHPESLQRRLEALGWHSVVCHTDRFFLYGTASPSRPLERVASVTPLR